MRVCQPGPVARHRSIISAGKRMVMSFLGLGECGRPPFLIVARASMSSVSSGSSTYSFALMTCESTRGKSEFKERREAFLVKIGANAFEQNALDFGFRFDDSRLHGVGLHVGDASVRSAFFPLVFEGKACDLLLFFKKNRAKRI